MGLKAVRRFVLPVGMGLVAAWLVAAGLSTAPALSATSQALLTASVIDRPQDPVVVKGANFPAFSGVPLDELVLYTYRSGAWTPIPFQIDEVSITGTYVISDDGLLDANDELVFMAGDTTTCVDTAWPADAQSRLHPRYVISVTDTLNPGGKARVYLYRSTTLTPSSARYITWTASAQRATAISYTAIFSPAKFVGLSDLMINSRGVDILDRQKTRVATPLGTLDEEEIVNFLGPTTITLPAVGPVRAVSNDGDLNAALYGSRIDFDVSLDLSVLGGFVDSIRTSFDWISPAVSGITTYYDSNTAGGVAIDGVPDVIPTTPPIDWFQVNGGAVGPGGLLGVILSVDPNGGTVSNYYKDNSAIDPNDTGDRRSYGDAGLRIDAPGPVISFTLVAYVLPPGTVTNVGVTYFNRANNPLAATAAQQSFASSAPDCLRVYMPAVMKNLASTP